MRQDTRRKFLNFLLVVVLISAGSPAAVSLQESIQTPSKNIKCLYSDEDNEFGFAVVCKILEVSRKSYNRPNSLNCRSSDWGYVFSLKARGNAQIECKTDIIYWEIAESELRYSVLNYGTSKTFVRSGITCISESAGLTCRNRSGNGFFISRSKQRIF